MKGNKMQDKVSATGPDMPNLVVQYNSDLMLVGVGLEANDAKPRHSFLDQIYGDRLTQIEIGKIFVSRMRDHGLTFDVAATEENVDTWHNDLGRTILDCVGGSKPFDGAWTWLERPSVNRLIRLLRNARDKSFGRDE